MKKMMRKVLSVWSLPGMLVWVGSAQAGIPINDGLYRLCNHPGGNANPPPYGLRLDGLDGDTSHHFTFDFEYDDGAGNRSDMRMRLDQSAGTIHIFGSVYGGLNDPANLDVYDSSVTDDKVGWWDIDFTYAMGVGTFPGDRGGYTDVAVDLAAQSLNTGTITRADGFGITSLNQTYNLVDKGSPKSGYTFRFGDESDGNGHRGHAGISGWGWLMHDGSRRYTANSDWLFTAKPVPTPGAYVLGLLGFTAVGLFRRKFK